MDGVIGDPASRVYWYHTDHLGTVQVISDAQGRVVWRNDYRAFGKQLGPEVEELTNTHAFTGKDWDEEVGLYYFNARWYEPEAGRFISEDPIQDDLNWYIYANNNPLRFIDPSGLWKYEVDLKTGEVYAVAESYDDDGDGKADRHDTLWGLCEEYYGAGTYYNKLANDNNIKDPANIQVGQRVKLSDYNNQGKRSHAKILKQGYILGSYSRDTLDDLQRKTGLDLRLSKTEQALYERIWGAKFALAQEKGDVEALAKLLEQRFSGFKYDPNNPAPLATQFFASQQGKPVPIMIGMSGNLLYFGISIQLDITAGTLHISKNFSPTSLIGVSFLDFSIGSGSVETSIGLSKYTSVGAMWELTESGGALFRGVTFELGIGISLPVNLTVEIPKF